MDKCMQLIGARPSCDSILLQLHGGDHQQVLLAALAVVQLPTFASRACLGFKPPYLADRESVCWVCVSGLFDSCAGQSTHAERRVSCSGRMQLVHAAGLIHTMISNFRKRAVRLLSEK
jgi:hypothetical protein